jgi:3-phosphoshikimate 1-carboxyvinyltransferase
VSEPASGAPRYRVLPGGAVAGTLTVPGDKSISHRALMLGAIARGSTRISGFLAGEDCLSTLRALTELAVPIERRSATEVTVEGVGMRGFECPAQPLDMGNAGTAMRLFTGLLAPQRFSSTLIGDESLMRRPMQRVVVPLAMMGAQIRTHDGRPPIEIRGTPQLRAIHYSLPVASAQVKSAVLLAGLAATGRTRVTEPAPSRDHTERMLASFGAALEHEGRSVSLEGGQTLQGTEVAVPADFSSAAFFIVAACLAASPSLRLTNVGINPTRTGLLALLRRMGADISVEPLAGSGAPGAEPAADLEIRAAQLRGITVHEAEVPLAIDEFPAFFIAAACASGETLVRGALELRVKESDRLAAMAAGLGMLGIEHQLLPDGLWLRGGRGFTGGTIDSRGDHRIAMAFAIAALRAAEPIEILNVANVATSFPGFVETARAAGLALELL